MYIKTNKKVLDEAIYNGCRTVAELALFLKNRANNKN